MFPFIFRSEHRQPHGRFRVGSISNQFDIEAPPFMIVDIPTKATNYCNESIDPQPAHFFNWRFHVVIQV